MKIYIVRIIGVVAVLVWLLVASYPQIVLAQTCTNSDNRPVPCPPSSGGGKRHTTTKVPSAVAIQATDTPIPLPTATVTVLGVIPATGGLALAPTPASSGSSPTIALPIEPSGTISFSTNGDGDLLWLPDSSVNRFLILGAVIVLLIGGLLFGLLVPAVRKRFLGAGPKNGWPLEFGSTTHVMMFDGDKYHHFSNEDQNISDSPDMDGRQLKINEAEEQKMGGGGSGNGTNTDGGRHP